MTQEFEPPKDKWPENGFRSQVDVTLRILEAIPDMPSRGIASGLDFDSIDTPRRERIEFLVNVAESFVIANLDPSPAVYGALPHIDKLFGGQLNYYLRFADVNFRGGNNSELIFREAEKHTIGIRAGFSARELAKIGVAKMNQGLDPRINFEKIEEFLRKDFEYEAKAGTHDLIPKSADHVAEVIKILKEAGAVDFVKRLENLY